MLEVSKLIDELFHWWENPVTKEKLGEGLARLDACEDGINANAEYERRNEPK